jgi:hypothetical protein
MPPLLRSGALLLAYKDPTLRIQSNHGRCEREFHHDCLRNRRVRLRVGPWNKDLRKRSRKALAFYQILWQLVKSPRRHRISILIVAKILEERARLFSGAIL